MLLRWLLLSEIFADSDDKRLLVKVGSTGVFQNRYGNQLIGKVTKKVDGATASYKMNEYALWVSGETTKLPATRFALHGDRDGNNSSLYNIWDEDDDGVNLTLTKQNVLTIHENDEGYFVEALVGYF